MPIPIPCAGLDLNKEEGGKRRGLWGPPLCMCCMCMCALFRWIIMIDGWMDYLLMMRCHAPFLLVHNLNVEFMWVFCAAESTPELEKCMQHQAGG